MLQINRRRAFSTLGLWGGTAMLIGSDKAATNAAGESSSKPSVSWDYVKLDPARVAERTYLVYPEGGCMYGVVAGVIGTLAEKVGEPFRSFPVDMMRFGDGGLGGCGSLCGVINGASALVGLFHCEKPKQQREAMINELVVWYETTPLPQYVPETWEWAEEVDPSISGSVLCHLSISRWCDMSGYDAFSMEKKERCRRLAADGAIKIVEMLNRDLQGTRVWGELTPSVQSCIDCHGEKDRADVMVKMNCGGCHQFNGDHP